MSSPADLEEPPDEYGGFPEFSEREIRALLRSLCLLSLSQDVSPPPGTLPDIAALRKKLASRLDVDWPPYQYQSSPRLHLVQWVRQDGTVLMDWVLPRGTSFEALDPLPIWDPIFVRYRELPDGNWVKGFWYPDGYPGRSDLWPEGVEIEERTSVGGKSKKAEAPRREPGDVIMEHLRLARERVVGTDPEQKIQERNRYTLMEERLTHMRQQGDRASLYAPPALGRPSALELRQLLGADPDDAELRRALAAWEADERGGTESEPDPGDGQLREAIAKDPEKE